MSRTYATPLELELSPSRQQHRLLLLVHILTAASILFLPWPVWLRLLCLIIVLPFSWYQLRAIKYYRHLVWESGNNWLLTIDNQSTRAALLPESLVTFWLVILLFELENGRHCSVLIWPDSLHANVWRKLQVRLKIESGVLFAPGSQ